MYQETEYENITGKDLVAKLLEQVIKIKMYSSLYTIPFRKNCLKMAGNRQL